MSRLRRRNPYCDFKDDRERRRALNSRAMWPALAVMVVALAGSESSWMERIQWLMHWLH